MNNESTTKNSAKKKIRRRITNNTAVATSAAPQQPSAPTPIKKRKSLRLQAYSPEDDPMSMVSTNSENDDNDDSSTSNKSSASAEQRPASSSPRLPRPQSLLASTPQTALATHSVKGVLPSPRTEEALAVALADKTTTKSLLADSWPRIPRFSKNFDSSMSTSPPKNDAPLTASQRRKIKEQLLADDPLPSSSNVATAATAKSEQSFANGSKVIFLSSSSIELQSLAATDASADSSTNAPSPRKIRQKQITHWLKPLKIASDELRRTKSLAHPLKIPTATKRNSSDDDSSDYKRDKDCMSEGAVETIHKLQKSTSDEKKKTKPTTLSGDDDDNSNNLSTLTKATSLTNLSSRLFAERHDSGSSSQSSSDVATNTQSTSTTSSTATTANAVASNGNSADVSLEDAPIFSLERSSSSEKNVLSTLSSPSNNNSANATVTATSSAANKASPRRKSMQFFKNMLSASASAVASAISGNDNSGDTSSALRGSMSSNSVANPQRARSQTPRSPTNARSSRQLSIDAVRQQEHIARGHSLIIFNSSAIVGDKGIRRYLVPNSAISIDMRFALQRAINSNAKDPLRECDCREKTTKSGCSKHSEYSVDTQAKFPVLVMLDKQYIRGMCTAARTALLRHQQQTISIAGNSSNSQTSTAGGSSAASTPRHVTLLEKFVTDYPDMVPGSWAAHVVSSATQTDFSSDNITHVYQLRAFV